MRKMRRRIAALRRTGTEGITHTVAEVHRAAPPAKKARTEKRKKKVKKYQNLIDARWCQYAFRGTGAKKRRATVDEVLVREYMNRLRPGPPKA